MSPVSATTSRFAPVRRRVRALKIGLVLTAAAAFGSAVGLARDAHPGASSKPGTSALTTPARLRAEASQAFFGASGGSIGATTSPPQAQTSTS